MGPVKLWGVIFLLVSSSASDRGFASLSQQDESRSPAAPLSFINDLVPLIIKYLQDAPLASNSSSIAECATDLVLLGESKEEVKSLGQVVVNVSAIVLAVDSAGKPPAGMLQGASELRGNLEECQMIRTTKMGHSRHMTYGYLTLTILSSVTHQAIFPTLREELCLPSSCNASAMEFVLVALNDTIQTRGLYVDTASSSYISYSMDPLPLTTGAIVMISVTAIIVLLVIIGSLVDRYWLELRDHVHTVCKFGDNEVGQINEEKHLLSNITKHTSRWSLFLYELITAFSLYKNVPMILSTRQPPSAITSMNGVRVISMFWVIMCHVYTLAGVMFPEIRNLSYVFVSVLPRFASQVIINGFFSVDSFFLLSGVLVSYLTLRDMKRRDGKFPLVPYYLHRILRLTPTYMFFLFFYWHLTVYMTQGPPMVQLITGYDGSEQQHCRAYWWTNLLYINNFHPYQLQDECMSWGWYLANDMQFYVISPLIIIPLFYWFAGGVVASSCLLLVSFAITGFITGFYNYPASVYLPMVWGLPSLNLPNAEADVYTKPYCRIGPYIIGLVLGAIFFYNFKPSLARIKNWLFYLVLWAVAFAVGMSAVYGLYGGFQGRVFTGAENVLYNMFSRTGWGVAVGILLYACHHGYGGLINSFLSMPFWIPLSRLTYTAYLVHPIVLVIIIGSEKDTMYYTDVKITVYIVGSTVLSYGVAALLSSMVEFPVANLEMAVFKLLGVKMRESARHIEIKEREISVNAHKA